MWPHYFLIMRTTLTLDDTLVTVLKKKAAEKGVPFKSVVNQALRYGLEAMDEPGGSPAPYQTHTRRLGLRTGLDRDKLGQIADELEDEQQVSERQ